MTRQTDLEQNIRASYDLIREYEAIRQTAADPKEKRRAQGEIAEQWRLIQSYLRDYRPLVKGAMPEDIAQIAAHFSLDDGDSASLDTAEARQARARYLDALQKQYGIVQTHAFTDQAKDEQVGQPRRIPLLGEEGVYIPLTFDAPSDKLMNYEPVRVKLSPLNLVNVLSLPGHLAFIGDAGSGKTTLLHVLVTALASADPAILVEEPLAESLPDPRPLPILLPLRLFEHRCNQQHYQRTLDDLLRFVDDWFATWCTGVDLPAGFLARHLHAGRAWLLLDALDEVADPDHRLTIRNIIEGLARDLHSTRIIVTARVAGYRNNALNNDHFTVVHVRDLDDDQRNRMIRAIYRGLALSDAERQASDLINRFEGLESLGRTPVMVWTAAVIHALRGELPESRAALYNAYVDILLKHSFKLPYYDTDALKELTSGQAWSLEDRRRYLTYAAFAVHRLLETDAERQGDDQLVVGEDELADEILAPYFYEEGLTDRKHKARRLAREFLSLMVAHSGLLYESSEGFSIGDHLTMREFLAGCYLADDFRDDDDEAYDQFLLTKVNTTWWREVFILAAGYLAERPSKAARRFLRRVADQGQSASDRLAAYTLAARGLIQLRHRSHRPAWYAGLARQLANQLYAPLYADPVPAPASLRQEAGLVLGLLHGYPDAPDAAGQPDPRFARPFGLPLFVHIEGGSFQMGSSEAEVAHLIKETGQAHFSRELPRHQVTLDSFELARYPTTNAIFAPFINAGGYQDERWWVEAIADDRWAEGKIRDYVGERTQPAYWADSRYNNPAQPVVGITWYEAVAYCRWLTATLQDGYLYRLPTEAEWEGAARGLPTAESGDNEGPRYPWGDDWLADHCNSKEAGLGTTSPVGLFSAGATPSGLHDLAGNVWEWCADWYAEDYYAQSGATHNPQGPARGTSRVLRGGSWYDEGATLCRCGSRYRNFPRFWYYLDGFRCARILSSS